MLAKLILKELLEDVETEVFKLNEFPEINEFERYFLNSCPEIKYFGKPVRLNQPFYH